MFARPAHRHVAVVAAVLTSLLLVCLSVARISGAAFTATTNGSAGWETGTVLLTDDDAGAAMFTTGDGLLDGGQTLTRCIAVTYDGNLFTDMTVRLSGQATGGLSPYLALTVDEGTGGSAGSCAGFASTSTLYTGALADFSTDHGTFAAGVSTWAPRSAPQTRTYRFALTVQNVTAAQAKSATGTFTWDAQPVHVFDANAVSNKALWLRANDLGAAGSTVTSWSDQSGRTVPVTASGAVKVALEGLKVTSATASQWYSSEPPQNAIDETLSSTHWTTNGGALPQWLRLNLETSRTVRMYTITRRDDIPTRNVKDWQLQGSNDGTTWTVVDTQTGVTWPTPGEVKRFNVATPTGPYAFYRVYITANNGDPSYTSITGITLHDTITPSKTVRVLGGNIALGAGSLPTTGADREMWVVVQGVVSGVGSAWHLGSGALNTNYVYNDGKVYDDSFVNARVVYTPTMPANTRRLLRITVTGGVWKAYLDGVLQATVTGVTPTFAASPSLANSWDGAISEVMIRTSVSDAQQVADLTAYFKAGHTLQ